MPSSPPMLRLRVSALARSSGRWLAFLLAAAWLASTSRAVEEVAPTLASAPAPIERPNASAANVTNRFVIRGMHCNACAKGLTSELKRVKGVADAEVSFTNRLAVVAYDTNRVAVPALLAAIREAGFEGEVAKRNRRNSSRHE